MVGRDLSLFHPEVLDTSTHVPLFAMARSASTLAEDEAAVYDRQLRVWGVETQKRLSLAQVLVDGRLGGMGAEVAKNLVLAGVGSLHVTRRALDPPQVSVEHFLDGESGAVDTLKDINPLVDVRLVEDDAAKAVEQYHLVLLVGGDASQWKATNDACREKNVKFLAAEGRSNCGLFFADLLAHEFKTERKKTDEDKAEEATSGIDSSKVHFKSFSDALNVPLSSFGRRTPPIFHLYRLVAQFEVEQNRRVNEEDYEKLRQLRDRLCSDEGPVKAQLCDEMVEDYLATSQEFAPINAIVGGVLAQEALKAISGKGEPLNNFFFYELDTGEGRVVKA